MRRYAEGEFGNAAPTWNTFKDWYHATQGDSDLTKYHIRNRVAGGMTYYDVPHYAMGATWGVAIGYVPESQLYISAMCPTERTKLQGEVQRDEQGLYLLATTVAKPMREALAESQAVYRGVLAKLLLQKHLNSRSYEWMEWLLDQYDGHIIEFTAFDRCWGTVPGHNTVFWEVRKY